MPLEAIFGECLNYKSGPRILIWPTEVPFLGLKDGHFWQKWLFSDHKKGWRGVNPYGQPDRKISVFYDFPNIKENKMSVILTWNTCIKGN